MITRRELLRLGGLTLSVMLTPGGYRILKAQEVPRRYAPNLWINLSKDNYLTVFVNKSEMGQGVYTGLPMLIAEELDFPWERVRVRPAPAGRAYVDPKMGIQLTGGSTSVRNMYETLRLAGASMREMLISSASKKLSIPAEQIRAERGLIVAGGRRYTYGEFADLAMKEPVPSKPRLKKPDEFIYIGRSVPRLDAPEKVEGRAIFGIDTFEDGMVYAVVERPPYFGAKPMKVEASEAKSLPEVVDVFPISTGVAVCGQSFWSCQKARERVRIEWSESLVKGWGNEDLERYFLQKLKERGEVVKVKGSPQKVFESSSTRLEETYIQPYLYHATMEPMACLAWVKKDECIVYAPTQSQTWVLEAAKRISGLPESRIRVITTYLGGGFGRKANAEFVAEALEISKRLGKPVKLIYTREDDIRSGYFRPYSATLLRASADQKGNITSLSFKIAVQPLLGGRASVEGVENMFYDIPNLHVERVDVELPVSVWFWRSVGSTHNALSLETFIDRIAYQTRQDPGELRLRLLKNNPVAYRVVQTAMEKAGWGRKKNLGIAYHYSFGSHACHVAEVSLDRKTGQVRVHRVVAVIDVGPVVVHPDLIRSQVEGAVVMGLSMALKEQVKFAGGGVENTNFGTYQLLRTDEAPEIEVHILTSRREMGGVGEPGLPPTAPAVANALLWGYGIRVNRLPMSPEYIKSLL
ncbi:MAG: xanthine dehydrogenase family protein molybdopterin-binding subunit [Aquificaceae bacterium]|jgi:isoquinoline 1-oxidoreductase beta subunit|uniref:xanthine dehydrogenase family protein molybdopterin-binding subunit n=1 Tax=Hydrogenobacter sp. Uz 6-8 TaxID=3384828 RepID=UPI00309D61BA